MTQKPRDELYASLQSLPCIKLGSTNFGAGPHLAFLTDINKTSGIENFRQQDATSNYQSKGLSLSYCKGGLNWDKYQSRFCQIKAGSRVLF